jgi:hypothetical protein
MTNITHLQKKEKIEKNRSNIKRIVHKHKETETTRKKKNQRH